MNLNPVVLAIPLYFFLIVLELIYEAIKKKNTYRLNDAVTNISCGITSQVSGAFLKVLGVGVYELVYTHFSFMYIPINWWTGVILFLAIDFFYYWYHRASHEINFLWNFTHVVHHQSEDYNLSVALRQNSLGSFFSMLFYLPLAFLGFSTLSFVAMKGINLIYQFWIHTDAINKLPRWIEYFLNTPSHHRVHHGRNPKYIDKNHAGVLIIWDRLFGTFKEEEERPTYGVTKPVRTWNPIKANLQPVYDMFTQVRRTPGWTDKLKMLVYKPGWQPDEEGGYQPAPVINSEDKKFNPSPMPRLFPYIVSQFVMLLVFTAYFLFSLEVLDAWMKGLFAFHIVLGVWLTGLILENASRWIDLEIIRATIVSPAVIVLLLPMAYWPGIALFVFLGGWLWVLKSKTYATAKS